MMVRKKILGVVAGAALMLSGGAAFASSANATGAVGTYTTLSTDQPATVHLDDYDSPGDATLTAQVKASDGEFAGAPVTNGSVQFSHNGTSVGTVALDVAELPGVPMVCGENTFTAHYTGVTNEYLPSTSQSVTVTLVGGTCGTPVNTPEYENCDAVRAAGYAEGIAEATDPELYAANEHLDADNDGVACEVDVPDGDCTENCESECEDECGTVESDSVVTGTHTDTVYVMVPQASAVPAASSLGFTG
jgi:hypothetical protein